MRKQSLVDFLIALKILTLTFYLTYSCILWFCSYRPRTSDLRYAFYCHTLCMCDNNLRAVSGAIYSGKDVKTGRTQKSGYSIYFLIQESEVYIKVLIWDSSFLCNNEFHNMWLSEWKPAYFVLASISRNTYHFEHSI